MAIAKPITQTNERKRKEGTMLEILDQSTARKTRHQTQEHKNNKQENRQRRARRTGTTSRAGQAKSPEANRPKCRAPNKEKKRGGEQRGARASNTRPMPDRGEDHEKGARKAGRKQKQPNKNNTKKRGEALTVLSQSTARKVRHLQIPVRGKNRCKKWERVIQPKRHPAPAQQPKQQTEGTKGQ